MHHWPRTLCECFLEYSCDTVAMQMMTSTTVTVKNRATAATMRPTTLAAWGQGVVEGVEGLWWRAQGAGLCARSGTITAV